MTRVLSGLALAIVFFALVWFANATVLLIVALMVGVLAFHEYAELMRASGAEVPRMPSLVATLATIALVPFPTVAGGAVMGIGLVVIAIAAMAALERRGSAIADPPAVAGPSLHEGRPLRAGAYSVVAGGFAVLYLGLPLGALVGVHIYGGRGAVILLVATIAISDTAQYYSGRLLGRRPLAPRLSPKKTLEGAIGGFVVAPLFLAWAGPYFVPVADSVTMAVAGVLIVMCGIAGDLFESMLKRSADMKDSSALIPGHGGVLDRIDALLFATPPFYFFLRWLYTV